MGIGKLEKVREAWEKETDEWLLKTATKNLNQYEREVRVIICEEGVKRGLIAYEVKEAAPHDIEFQVTVTEKGQDISAELEETAPKVVSIKLVKTIVVFVSVAAVFGVIGLIFGVSAGILSAGGGYIMYMAMRKIWPSEEERKIRRELSRDTIKWAKDHPEESQEIIRKTMEDLDIDRMFKPNRKQHDKR